MIDSFLFKSGLRTCFLRLISLRAWHSFSMSAMSFNSIFLMLNSSQKLVWLALFNMGMSIWMFHSLIFNTFTMKLMYLLSSFFGHLNVACDQLKLPVHVTDSKSVWSCSRASETCGWWPLRFVIEKFWFSLDFEIFDARSTLILQLIFCSVQEVSPFDPRAFFIFTCHLSEFNLYS